ncbi:HNH endonuclease signature motif containing protein [Gordonia sinesedis]
MLATVDDLHGLVDAVAQLPLAESESNATQRIAALEELKAACAAAQARETARIDELRRRDEECRNVPRRKQGRGLASEIGLARKASPRKGAQYLGFARALVHEMPHTLAALTSGVLTEWRATLVVRETAHLSRETRTEIDRRICADPAALVGVGDREIEAMAKRHAYELDPAAVVARTGKAAQDRRVTVRPAPDVMSQISALLPVAQGVAVYAALKRHADSTVGADDRTHAQIIADTLVERVTGQASASAVPVAVEVVMSEQTLLGGTDGAELPGFGPIPGHVARELIADGIDADDEVVSSLRRLYARPADGSLVSMDSRSRCFPAGLARFIARRDRRCRMAYCDGAIAEIDHAYPHRHGGATSADNGDGTCRDHNRAKEADGWQFRVGTIDGRHRIDVTTPTGEIHHCTAPPAVGYQPDTVSVVETELRAWLNAA